MKFNKIVFLSLITLLVYSCKSVERYNKHIETEVSVKDLIEDVNYVEKNLFKMYPNLDWYIGKEQLHKKFDSLRRTINKPLKPNDFYLKISSIVSQVKQGHMYIMPLLKKYREVNKDKYKGSKSPLSGYKYIYKDNKLYISANLRTDESEEIQIGSEVLSINSLKPQDLFKKYRNTFTSDGNNQTMIPYIFAKRANMFYLNEFGYQDSLQLKISCSDSTFLYTSRRVFKNDELEKKEKEESEEKSKNKETVKVKKYVLTEIEEERKEQIIDQKKEKRSLFGYDEKYKQFSKDLMYPVANDSTVALLKIRGFMKGDIDVYDTIFSELKSKNIQNLIIDVRNNTGGRISEVAKLAEYLNPKPFFMFQKPEVAYQLAYFNILRGPVSPLKVILMPYQGAVACVLSLLTQEQEDGTFLTSVPWSKELDPSEVFVFEGPIYVLTNGLTFSAAAVIAAHLKSLPNVTVVGEETGGAHNGTVAGFMPVLELPNTHLSWRVGLMSIRVVNQVKEEGRGVIPDKTIQTNINDLINQNDQVLDWVLNDIQSKNNN